MATTRLSQKCVLCNEEEFYSGSEEEREVWET
jgi:hypothetical protein